MSTLLIAPALLLSVLAFPVAAEASNKVVDDCVKDGAVNGKYSNGELRDALKSIPSDSSEYSDCRAVIQAAVKPASSKKSSSDKKKGGGGGTAGAAAAGGSGGSSSDDDARNGVPVDLNGDGKISSSEKKAAKDKQLAFKRDDEAKATDAKLGPAKTDPTKVGALDASDTSNGLPLPVLLAIIALALLAVAAGTILIGRRNPSFAQTMRRVPVPKRFRSK